MEKTKLDNKEFKLPKKEEKKVLSFTEVHKYSSENGITYTEAKKELQKK